MSALIEVTQQRLPNLLVDSKQIHKLIATGRQTETNLTIVHDVMTDPAGSPAGSSLLAHGCC
jgi:hypothetical protein